MTTAVANSLPSTLPGILSNFNINELQVKQIGIKLLIAQLAAEEPVRLKKLIDYRNLAEEKLFDPKVLPHLSHEELTQRYQLVTAAEKDTYSQIQRLSTEVNLEDIKTSIQILQQSIGTNSITEEELAANDSANEIANSLLRKLQLNQGQK